MNPEDFEVKATVSFSTTTCRAVTTMKIRFYSTAHSGGPFPLLWRDCDNFNAQFVTQDAGIGEERLFTLKGV
jgi:hypothetical protein